MNKRLFDDIPGVGEIMIYSQNPITKEENRWIDQLSFRVLKNGVPIALPLLEFDLLHGIEAKHKAIELA